MLTVYKGAIQKLSNANMEMVHLINDIRSRIKSLSREKGCWDFIPKLHFLIYEWHRRQNAIILHVNVADLST
jgi:hypothetical protein